MIPIDTFLFSVTVDVTNAGEGQLEIMVNNGNLPNTVEMETAGVYKIAFVPEQAGKQYVDINFNREPLPGIYNFLRNIKFINYEI